MPAVKPEMKIRAKALISTKFAVPVHGVEAANNCKVQPVSVWRAA